MAKKATKCVYFFGGGKAEGRASMKSLLGGKGANLAEMSSLGLPVPPGFTITTEVCDLYYKHGRQFPPGLDAEVTAHIARLEQLTGKTFGCGDNPLLVSVRSGAAASMPGMDAAAPLRTETSSGFGPRPNVLPVRASSQAMLASIWASSPAGYWQLSL